MATSDNPARRLYRLLLDASKQNGRGTVRAAWSNVLLIDAANTVEVFSYLKLLSELMDEVEERIRSISGINHTFYLQNFATIRRAVLHSSLDSAWSDPVQWLTDVNLRDVAHCAEKLAEYSEEAETPDEKIKELLDELGTLARRASSSGIGQDIKVTVGRIFRILETALRQYRVTGVSGLRTALSSALGELMLAWLSAKPVERAEPIWEDIVAYLSLLDGVLADETGQQPRLASSIGRLLPSDLRQDP